MSCATETRKKSKRGTRASPVGTLQAGDRLQFWKPFSECSLPLFWNFIEWLVVFLVLFQVVLPGLDSCHGTWPAKSRLSIEEAMSPSSASSFCLCFLRQWSPCREWATTGTTGRMSSLVDFLVCIQFSSASVTLHQLQLLWFLKNTQPLTLLRTILQDWWLLHFASFSSFHCHTVNMVCCMVAYNRTGKNCFSPFF